MEVLRLHFRPDDEWLGELTLGVTLGDFTGVGTAWFSKETLREFADALMAFPLSAEQPPSISGGNGGNDTVPAQEQVSIKFEPHNILGAVRATVHVETDFWDGRERGLTKEATMRFLVTYGDLGRFAPAILDLLDGRAIEAVLTTTP